MADLPLPEALIDAMLIAYAGRGFHSTRRAAMRSLLAAALAFRDESGHRAVWSAEEVAAIEAERDEAQRLAKWWECAAADAAMDRRSLKAEVEPLIEALAALNTACDRLPVSATRGVTEIGTAMERARAALARVHPETCPTCGETGEWDWIAKPCDNPFHGRTPEGTEG